MIQNLIVNIPHFRRCKRILRGCRRSLADVPARPYHVEEKGEAEILVIVKGDHNELRHNARSQRGCDQQLVRYHVTVNASGATAVQTEGLQIRGKPKHQSEVILPDRICELDLDPLQNTERGMLDRKDGMNHPVAQYSSM